MRRSWDADEEVADLDEPVTITGRQLRSLKRGARVGAFGILLAFVAIGLATWNLLSFTRSAANNDASESPAPATPADSGSTAMETATPGGPTATGTAPAATTQEVQPVVPSPAATSAAPAPAAAPAVAAKPASTSGSASASKAAAVRRGRLATAQLTARTAVSTPGASSRQPERGVPIDMPTPALTAPSPAPAPAKTPAKPAAPADTARGQ